MKRLAIEWYAYAALLLVGGVIDVLCRLFPSELPFWLPWEFSWPVFLATALTFAWYERGWRVLAPSVRPALWRTISFVAGVLLFYVVLQTHVDYLAQHMFFVHRWAHFWLHHAGGLLIAFGMSGQAIRAGMPSFLRPLIDAPPVRAILDVLQHKAVAPVLFVGLLYFWL